MTLIEANNLWTAHIVELASLVMWIALKSWNIREETMGYWRLMSVLYDTVLANMHHQEQCKIVGNRKAAFASSSSSEQPCISHFQLERCIDMQALPFRISVF